MRTFTAPSGATVTESDDLISITWSWTDEYPDFAPVPHEIVWIKGDSELIFRTKRASDGTWASLPVRHPDYRPTSERTAREMVHKFIDAGGDE